MTFKIGDRVRYKPGVGTYNYEDVLEADGRVPGEVVGFTKSGRVRVSMRNNGGPLTRGVDAASLTKADPA